MARKKIVFLDMDGVLADFSGAVPHKRRNPPEMYVEGFFRNLRPIPGCKAAVGFLMKIPNVEIYVGSKPVSDSPISFTEKAQWIGEHLPELKSRIVLVCDKSLLRGDYLIDDEPDRWAHKFKGRFITFRQDDPVNSWMDALKIIGGRSWKAAE